jgi:N-acetylmuramoyl-L-alanine amidase
MKKIRLITISLLVTLVLLVLTACEEDKVVEPITEGAPPSEEKMLDAEGFSPVKGYVQTTQDNTILYVSPNETSDVYVTLNKGVDLSRTGVKEGWVRILLNGGNYYVKSSSVKETDITWATKTDANTVTHIVFIDPGKQVVDDKELEPISPDVDPDQVVDGAGMKVKMPPAAVGVSTERYEYDVTMDVANHLKSVLVQRGYTVYVSRESSSVNLSNARRASMANADEAEVYIKLEAGEVSDPTTMGVIGFITTSTNTMTGSNYQNNYLLCYDILKNISEDTTATRLGIYETDDLTSLNYCKMPATVINVGFLSNQYDDQALADPDYQRSLATAIADGVDDYFKEKSE